MYKNLSTQTEVKVKKNTHKSQKNNRTFTSTATPAANTAFCCLHFYSCRFRSICEHNRQTVVMVVCPRLCVIVYVMFWQNKKKKKQKYLHLLQPVLDFALRRWWRHGFTHQTAITIITPRGIASLKSTCEKLLSHFSRKFICTHTHSHP